MRLISLHTVFTLGLFLLCLGFLNEAEAQSSVFSRDLRQGNSGEDILLLQKTLNIRPETGVSLSGVGSPGNETTFFGPLTREAVLKFQELYREEILRPAGLIQATGFVGLYTRRKLNEVYAANLKSKKISEQTVVFSLQNPALNGRGSLTDERPESRIQESRVVPLPPENLAKELKSPISELFSLAVEDSATSTELVFFYPSQYSGIRGTTITLVGSGFVPEGNAVFFGNKTLANQSSPSGKEIIVSIPDVPPGRYEIAISNGKTRSNSHYFHVVVPGKNAPSIQSITPAVAKNGESLTIRGERFTSTDNIVYTGFSVIEHVASSDGKTIRITLNSPWSAEEGFEENIPLWFYVENDNGFSNQYVVTLTF